MKNNISIIHKGRLKLKKYFSVFAFTLSLSAFAQTTTENYVYSKERLSEDGSKKSETIQYYDGLGRPKQAIQVKFTPLGQDLVVPITYDQLGRQTRSILPVPVPTSNLSIQSVSEATANAYYGVPNAYSEQKLEASPLARVLETASPGSEWAMNSGHTVKASYEINKSSDKVKKFSFTNSWVSTIAISSVPTVSFYNEKVLIKTSGTDEDGNKTIEFTNGLGQTILVRKVISATENADTYYLYNDYGHLVYVISPKADAQITPNNNIITQQVLNDLCYQYKYDNRGRLAEKKVPGKGWEYMVYNKADRLILTQDTLLKEKGQWLFTKYDQLGRVVYTGITNNASSRASMQNSANANANLYETRTATAGLTINGMPVYYTNVSTSTGVTQVLSINYYDTYPQYSFNPAFPSAIFGKPVLKDDLSGNVNTKAMPVMSLVKNIEDDNWTKNYNYYDTKGRPVGGYSINHLGGYTKTESELDFSGVPLQVKTYHKRLNTDTERVITENFTYDNQNRLLTHTHQVDSNTPEILTQNKYNELSQLQSKKVGGTSAASPLQTVDYTYNIKGWLTRVNDPKNLNGRLFGYELKYQNPDNTSYTKFNGNVSETDWKTSVDNVLKRYIYAYDQLNRLTAGYYQEPTTSVPVNHFYNEEIAYDPNGNITRLQRNMKGSNNSSEYIDNIYYTYSGNRLTSASDITQNFNGYPTGGNQIGYDNNGNMINQLDKGISSIQYNYLNLTKQITQNSKVINYYYRADGVKIKKSGPAESNTDYLDGFQYTEGSIKFVQTSEGYFNFENNKYIYNYTDHLGNIRLSYYKNETGIEILEESNYYPFGLKHGISNPSVGNPSYKYKYNGKELQETGMYDYGARMYMPDLGRWGVTDPLAEASRSFTPYHYGNNNPIMFIDPDGRITESFIKGMLSAPSGTTWYNTGMGFTNDQGGSMDYDGNRITWGIDYTRMLMQSVGLSHGGEGGGGEMLIHIPEVIITGRKGKGFAEGSYNSFMMEVKADNARLAWNLSQSRSLLYDAIENTKVGQSVSAAENFLFLELPASMVGGELLAAGWKAAGMSRLICRPAARLTNGLIKLCFTEGTLVAVEKGSKKIEDIKEGDLVWSYNEKTGQKELKKVVELSRNTSSSLVKISVSGTEIICTPEHPFYVNGNWVEAKDLVKGMALTTLDGKTSTIESIKFLDEKVKVYNFEVEGNHNYYVSEKGILVHNDCGLPQLLSRVEGNMIGGEFKYASGEIIDFLGYHNAKGSTLEITEMAFYPRGAIKNEMANQFGNRQMIQSLKVLQNYARENGFTHLRLQFERAANSSAKNPGHIFDQLFKL
ncbi:DUF6443 domain-containing protein [Chryseobacterium sp. HR92]|uniref:DUF6443 domain-containing protein n=2 Tax=unclassified Chryseobacterium TaxID=2593645 RepID=UPI00388DE60F|nr:polymorphic toxin-type HINT domain-containing protein [Chryseobacterium sp. HR92]